jgi:DNA-binding NarL/FixJ family response regulator
MIQVLIADDHTILRQGLRRILAEDAALTVVGEAITGEEAVARALELLPDVVLMDVNLPQFSGIEAARRIRAARPEIRVLMLTVSDKDQDLIDALKAGARGYLLKSAEAREVTEAIQRVHAGEAILPPALAARVLDELASPPPSPGKLTPRETEVLQLVAEGLGNKEIAATLSISENTVKTHVRHILDKLGLRSRTEAAAYAMRSGLVSQFPSQT